MMRIFFRIALLSTLASTAIAADANKPHPHSGIISPYAGRPKTPTLTEDELAKLQEGKAVKKQSKDGSSGGRGIAVQDVHATPEVIWQQILDFSSYPFKVDNLKECKVYDTSNGHIKARFLISTTVMNVDYFIDHTVHQDQNYMTWTLDYSRESDLDDSVGFWIVEPLPQKPGWSRLYYSVDVRLKGWIPGFIENMIAKTGLTKATAWVKRESEKTPAP